jgi:outer membrane protein
MRKFLFYSLMLGFPFLGYSQSLENIDLDQAIQIGLLNRKDILNAQLLSKSQVIESSKVNARRLPTISASGDARYNYLLQTNVIPGAAFPNSSGQPSEDREVQFGTNFNVLFGLQATQKLFDPTLKTDKEIANLNIEKSKLEEQSLKNSAAMTIAEQYLNVYFVREKLNLTKEKKKRWEDVLEITSVKLKEGVSLTTDYEKTDLELNTVNANLTNEEINYQKGLESLSNLLGFEPSQKISLADSISLLNMMKSIQNNESSDVSKNRPEWKKELIQNKIDQLAIGKIDKQYLPTLNLVGALNAQHLSNDFNIGQSWFPFGYLGVNANYVIFDGNLKRKNKEQLAIQKSISDNNLILLKNQYNLENNQILNDIKSARVNFENAQKNRSVAKRILERDVYSYKNGVSSLIEVKNSENMLSDANSSYLNALIQILILEKKRIKASGLLN